MGYFKIVQGSKFKVRQTIDFIGSNRTRGASPRGADNLTQKNFFRNFVIARTFAHMRDESLSDQPIPHQSIID